MPLRGNHQNKRVFKDFLTSLHFFLPFLIFFFFTFTSRKKARRKPVCFYSFTGAFKNFPSIASRNYAIELLGGNPRKLRNFNNDNINRVEPTYKRNHIWIKDDKDDSKFFCLAA